jgi:probable rRNA maturation factor
MLNFFSEIEDFKVKKPQITKKWLKNAISSEGFELSALNYIFCNDDYLHKMNVEYLEHDTLTDIITFDNSEDEGIIEGDIFISIERVQENAEKFNVTFDQELRRVMVHGVLHLCGYHDKTEDEQQLIRQKENENLVKFVI